jgi:hypothetical protein
MRKRRQRLPPRAIFWRKSQTSCSKSKHEDGKRDRRTDRIQYKQIFYHHFAAREKAPAKPLNHHINGLIDKDGEAKEGLAQTLLS